MNNSPDNSYSDAVEVMEAIEEKYRSFADSQALFDSDFDIEYNIEDEIIYFNYKEGDLDKNITVANLGNYLVLEGAAFREAVQGTQIAHMPVGPVAMEKVDDQLKAVYGALEDPDNWEYNPEYF